MDGLLCKDVLDRLSSCVVEEVVVDQEIGLKLSNDEVEKIRNAAKKHDITALVECSASWQQVQCCV